MLSGSGVYARTLRGLFFGIVQYLLIALFLDVLSLFLLSASYVLSGPNCPKLNPLWLDEDLLLLLHQLRQFLYDLGFWIFFFGLADLAAKVCTRRVPFAAFQQFLRNLTGVDLNDASRQVAPAGQSRGSQTEPEPPVVSVEEMFEVERSLLSKSRELGSAIEKISALQGRVTMLDGMLKRDVHRVFQADVREKEMAELVEQRTDLCDKLSAEKKMWQGERQTLVDDYGRLQQTFLSMEARVSGLLEEKANLEKQVSFADARGSNLVSQLSTQKEDYQSREAEMQDRLTLQTTVITECNRQLSELQEDLRAKQKDREFEITEVRKDLSFTKTNETNLIAQLSLQKEAFDMERLELERDLSVRGNEAIKLREALATQENAYEQHSQIVKDENERQLQKLSSEVEALGIALACKAEENDLLAQQLQERAVSETRSLPSQTPRELAGVIGNNIAAIKLPHNPLKEWASHKKMFLTARMRPLSEEEQSKNATYCLLEDPDEPNIIALSNARGAIATSEPQRRQAPSSFRFDRVFRPENSNADIFEAFSYLAAGFVQGYNVGIISDGPSGSGKTHTMLKGERGLIATAIHSILDHGLPKDRVLNVRAIEVYKEQMRDLAAEVSRERGAASTQLGPSGGKSVADRPVTPQRQPFQMTAKTIAASWQSHSTIVVSADDTYETIVDMCSGFDKKRVNRDTAMNGTANASGSTSTVNKHRHGGSSSRGHLIVAISIGKQAEADETGLLTFVDLAGSELADENGHEAAQEYEDIRKDRADCYHVLSMHRDRRSRQAYNPQRMFGHLIKNLLEDGGRELKLAHIFHFTPLSYELNQHLMTQVKLLSKVDMAKSSVESHS